MQIILRESEYAKKCIEQSSYFSNIKNTAYIVAKYFYRQGYEGAALKRRLEEFFMSCGVNISTGRWESFVDKMIRYAKKYNLVNIEHIPITESEMNICKSLSQVKHQKFLFSLIALTKYHNIARSENNNWVNTRLKNVSSLANIDMTVKARDEMLGVFYDAGIISLNTKIGSMNVRMNIIDDDSEPVVLIRDMIDLGFQYDNLTKRKKQYKQCVVCNRYFKSTANRAKYCNECSIVTHRKKNAALMARKRAAEKIAENL